MSFPEESFAFGMAMPGKLKKDLYFFICSVAIGIFFGVITGFPTASPVFTAFLKEELQLSNTLYAVFVALPFFAVILQIPFSSHLSKHPKVKSYFIFFSFIARLNFAAIGILSYLLRGRNHLVLISLMLFFQAFTSVVWWLADLCISIWLGASCPPSASGRFFSTRQMVFTSMQLIYSFALAIILRVLENSESRYLILFCLAAFFGCLDILCFFFIREPEQKVSKRADLLAGATEPEPEEKISYLTPIRHQNYRNYLLFAMFWSFGLFLTTPYTNVYMLEVLMIPVSRQTLYATLLPGIATVLFIRISGLLSDRYGFRNVLLLTASLSAVHPFIWLFITPRTEFMIVILNFLWGVTASATDLAIFSMGIYLAPTEQRTIFVSAKSVGINLLGIAPAILIGGILMDLLQPTLSRATIPFVAGQELLPFHVLLVIGGVFRCLAILLFARKIETDRQIAFRSFMRTLGQGIRFRFRLSSGLLNRRFKK